MMSDELQPQLDDVESQEMPTETPATAESSVAVPSDSAADLSPESAGSAADRQPSAETVEPAMETLVAESPIADAPAAELSSGLPMPPEAATRTESPATAEAIAATSALGSSHSATATRARLTPLLPMPDQQTAAFIASSVVSSVALAAALAERIPPLRLTPLRRSRRVQPLVWGGLATIALLIVLPALLAATIWPALGISNPFGGPPDRIPRGASAWANAAGRTPLAPANSAFGAQSYPVSAQFTTAYNARGGQATLGPAVTPAFTCNLGVVQFFAAGALLQATSEQPAKSTAGADDLDPSLMRDGDVDPTSGVIWLPLSHALLSAGSEAPIGGSSSTVTYVTLRAATQAAALQTGPAHPANFKANAPLPQTITVDKSAFVIEGSRAGKLVGHSIPTPIWSYINQPQIAPHGWMHDIGEPLTDALPITITSDGQQHHLLAQAFWQTIIIADVDNPTVTVMEPVGLDYLHTLGAPSAHPSAGAQLWTAQDGALRSAPGASNQAVSLSANAAVTLTGAAQWSNGALWYAANWSSPSRKGVAWVAADALTATQPSGQVTAGFDALSSSLASYLSSHGDDVGAVVYDMTRNTTYTYQPNQLFIMASSAKVPLMVSYLAHIEAQGRGPNSYELSVLTSMIEQSDNNAAQVIYDTLGDDSGQRSYMRSWGITDYTPDPNGWGWGQWSPADMAHLLTLLQTGKVLNSSDRSLAFSLMRHVESDQRFGVGDTAPAGATVAMKDGWVPGPDGAWAVNTSGVVTVGSETYIITVYTREQNSFSAGQDIVNHVCGVVAQALK